MVHWIQGGDIFDRTDSRLLQVQSLRTTIGQVLVVSGLNLANRGNKICVLVQMDTAQSEYPQDVRYKWYTAKEVQIANRAKLPTKMGE